MSNGAGGNVCQCGVSTRPGAQVRPVALDAAERWDRAIVHTLSGTYGDYLRAKVARVFPALTATS